MTFGERLELVHTETTGRTVGKYAWFCDSYEALTGMTVSMESVKRYSYGQRTPPPHIIGALRMLEDEAARRLEMRAAVLRS